MHTTELLLITSSSSTGKSSTIVLVQKRYGLAEARRRLTGHGADGFIPCSWPVSSP